MPDKNKSSQAKKILVEVSPREAHMLVLIRQHQFAEFVVKKKANEEYIIDSKISNKLDETTGLSLAVNLVKHTS